MTLRRPVFTEFWHFSVYLSIILNIMLRFHYLVKFMGRSIMYLETDLEKGVKDIQEAPDSRIGEASLGLLYIKCINDRPGDMAQ